MQTTATQAQPHKYPLLYSTDGRRMHPPEHAHSLRVLRLTSPTTGGRPALVRLRNRQPWALALDATPEELEAGPPNRGRLVPGDYQLLVVDANEEPIGGFVVDYNIEEIGGQTSAAPMNTAPAPSMAPEIAQAFVAYRQMAETAANIIRQMGEANAKLVQAHAHTLPHMPTQPQITALAPMVQEAPGPTPEEDQAREEHSMRKFMSDVADVARAAETFAPVVLNVVRGGRAVAGDVS